MMTRLFHGLFCAAVLMVPACKPAPLPPGAAHPLRFQLILMTDCEDDGTPVFPKKLLELENQKVSLEGFMAPYEDPQDMSKFLLTRSSANCYFCNPPEANGVVFVRLAKGQDAPKAETGNVALEGTLRLIRRDCKDPEARQFLYLVEDARILRLEP